MLYKNNWMRIAENNHQSLSVEAVFVGSGIIEKIGIINWQELTLFYLSGLVLEAVSDTRFIDQESGAGRILLQFVPQLGHINA